jgi:hypothetical protein
MPCYIDDLIVPGPNKETQVLVGDSLAELHRVAGEAGLVMEDFRPSPPFVIPHYLLSAASVSRAVQAGAMVAVRPDIYMALEDARQWWRRATIIRIIKARKK